jgi:hypothetical protein
MEPIKLDAEQVLAEQVRILLGRLMDAESRAARAEAAANVLAARLATPPDAPPDK